MIIFLTSAGSVGTMKAERHFSLRSLEGVEWPPGPLLLEDGGGGGGPGGGGGGGGPPPDEDGGGGGLATGGEGAVTAPLVALILAAKLPMLRELLPPKAHTASEKLYPQRE